jgi:hypothetical protein
VAGNAVVDRNILQSILSDRVKTCGTNHRRSCCTAVGPGRQCWFCFASREITHPLQGGGRDNRRWKDTCHCVQLKALIRQESERFRQQRSWTTKRRTVLMLLEVQWHIAGSKIVACIEHVVTQVFIGRAMIFIGSRASNHVDHTAGCTAKLRIEVTRQNTDLAQSIRIGSFVAAAGTIGVVIGAVEIKTRRVHRKSIHAKVRGVTAADDRIRGVRRYTDSGLEQIVGVPIKKVGRSSTRARSFHRSAPHVCLLR